MKKILLLVALFLSVSISVYSQVNVKFSVDMTALQTNGYFVPGSDTVRVAGDFNGWSTTANDLVKGTGADSAVYSATVAAVPTGAINYKFIFSTPVGLQWETLANNRQATIGTSDMTLPTVPFYTNVDGAKEHVWFKVDMTVPIKSGAVIPGTTPVLISGTMNGWSTTATPMTKDANDSVYAVLVDSLPSGSIQHFKFIYGSGTVTWESPVNVLSDGNRPYMVPEQDSSVFSAFWNDVNPNIQLGNGKINFTLDMSVMAKCGIYNTVKDSVLISGGFNGWTTTDPTQFLAQNPINDSLYFISHQFTTEPYGVESYKYDVKKVNPTGIDTIWKDGYERPVAWGGSNRPALFHGETSRDTSDWYDGVHPDWFIPSNIDVVFIVDMNPAMDGTKQAIPFDPAADTLYWLSEEPAFARTQGWYNPSDGHMRILKLTAQGGGIYSATMHVKAPAFNAFEYKYEWQKGSDATWVSEPDALGTNFVYRIRYVGQDKASSFPKLPWKMPKDTWTNAVVKTDQEKDPYTSLTGIKNESLAPVAYSLSQNYPNPFNPSTTIKFSVSKNDLVVLKIYNVLGQEVITLVNEQLKPGSYSYKFDASRLSSGIYFYSINSGSFSQTKKMILLK
jgi:hypothetical protein